jgi:hypothetical protein
MRLILEGAETRWQVQVMTQLECGIWTVQRPFDVSYRLQLLVQNVGFRNSIHGTLF